MPPHLNYVEPYCGGCSVLFERDPDDKRLWWPGHEGVSEVINDLDGQVSNFWRVVQNAETFPRFQRHAQAIPFSGIEFVNAKTILKEPYGDLDQAIAFFVVNRQSLAGRMTGFTGITKTRTRARMNNETSAWISAVDGLPAVYERLRRVLVTLPMDALDVIDKFDAPETLFYLDPPYVHSTRKTTTEYGLFEMSEFAHERLLSRLATIRGKFILSGYPNPLYEKQASYCGWKQFQYSLPNNAAGGKTKRRMTECLWLNYVPR